MKVPIGSFNDVDPNDPEIEFRKKRWDYWNALKKLKELYTSDPALMSRGMEMEEFANWVEEQYGIRITVVDGNITDHYVITHEGLYSFFLLKYM